VRLRRICEPGDGRMRYHRRQFVQWGAEWRCLRWVLKRIRWREYFTRLTLHRIHLQCMLRGDIIGSGKFDERLDIDTDFDHLMTISTKFDRSWSQTSRKTITSLGMPISLMSDFGNEIELSSPRSEPPVVPWT
jgi:hypothetical protein